MLTISIISLLIALILFQKSLISQLRNDRKRLEKENIQYKNWERKILKSTIYTTPDEFCAKEGLIK